MNSPTAAVQSDRVPGSRYCIRCAYSLAGLGPEGACPECGTSIALSMRELTLAGAHESYRETLIIGLRFVLWGILLSIVLVVAAMFTVLSVGASSAVTSVISGVSLLVGLMIAAGYWWYTSPDPSQVALEATAGARRVARAAVVVQVLIGLGGAVISWAALAAPPWPTVSEVLGYVSLVAWAVQFFAIMNYTRWIATRIPDDYVLARTKRYRWLLPVLGTVGVLALGLGPLIALILYWNLLDRVRKQVVSIHRTGEPKPLPGRIARR